MLNCVSYPTQNRNYCLFDDKRINDKKDIKIIKNTLDNPKTEEEILESLYALNLMLDEDKKYIEEAKNIYPTLAKYNNTSSPKCIGNFGFSVYAS